MLTLYFILAWAYLFVATVTLRPRTQIQLSSTLLYYTNSTLELRGTTLKNMLITIISTIITILVIVSPFYLFRKSSSLNSDNQKENLLLDKSMTIGIIGGFIVAFIIVVVIQHFGTIPACTNTVYTDSRDYLFWFTSPFDYFFDFAYSEKCNPPYILKLWAYVRASIAHFQYILAFWIPISAIIYLIKKYNVKVN